MNSKWQVVADLTACLHDFYKQHNYQANNFITSADAESCASTTPTAANVDPCFLEFNRRIELLAFVSLTWCPVLYTSANDSDVSEDPNFDSASQFALLAAGTRSGHVAFFKVSVPVLQSPACVSFVGFLEPQTSWSSCLAWHSDDCNRGACV